MVNLLVIDEQAINAMQADHRITEILPCLKSTRESLAAMSPEKAGCGVCAGKRAAAITNIYLQAKQCIIKLRGEQLDKVRTLLNAKQLRVYVRRTAYTLGSNS